MSSTDQAARKAELATALQYAREKTLLLLEAVPQSSFNMRVHDFYSPIGWHFGHIGMTEEHWVQVNALGRPRLNPSLSFLFANLPENPKDNRVHLPAREEIVGYLAETRRNTLRALEEADLTPTSPVVAEGYAWEFALQHECQHQETIVEMLQLIHKRAASSASPLAAESDFAHFSASRALAGMTALPGGKFRMGTDNRLCYDNEQRTHSVQVAPFELDRTPVTSAQWLSFMEDGGYRNGLLWDEKGFQEWALPNGIHCPEYWHCSADGGLSYVGPLGMRRIDPEEPVCGISWYEADAFARWAGKRLPTEAEWEFAAAHDPSSPGARLYPWGDTPPEPRHAAFGLSSWQPDAVGKRPAGKSASGLLDMAGEVWEWTASPFLPYPGFQAFPYDGYSKDHMDGRHFVCRGGSWATAGPLLRCSFRNWYLPTYRQGFLGLRCARGGQRVQ